MATKTRQSASEFLAQLPPERAGIGIVVALVVLGAAFLWVEPNLLRCARTRTAKGAV
jgi:hypothetical protein